MSKKPYLSKQAQPADFLTAAEKTFKAGQDLLAQTKALYGRGVRFLSDENTKAGFSDHNHRWPQPGDWGLILPPYDGYGEPEPEHPGSFDVLWLTRKGQFYTIQSSGLDEVGVKFDLLPVDSRGGS